MAKVNDCIHLGYTRQYMDNGRYLAEVTPGFGACVYSDAKGGEQLHAQCFPIDKAGMHDLTAEYITHVVTYANTSGQTTTEMRRIYPYIMVHDLLTLRCLLDEAAEQWRKSTCSTNSPR